MKPLNPVMAAFWAASAALPLLSAGAFATTMDGTRPVGPVTLAAPPAPGSCAETTKDEKTADNILACYIRESPAARKDVSDRILRLILDPDAQKRSYLVDGFSKNPEAKTDVAAVFVAVVVAKWVEANPGNAAKIYFAARPLDDKTPAWLPKEKVIFKEEDKGLSGRLGHYLAGEYPGQPEAKSWVKTITGKEKSVTGFLLSAADGSDFIRKDSRDMKAVTGDVASHEAPPVQAPPQGSGKGAFSAGGSAGNFDSTALYRTGAKVFQVYGPGDEGFREFSVKMATIKKDGVLQNVAVVVDITKDDATSPYGPEIIPFDRAAESTFTMRKGGRKYELKLSMEAGVHLIEIKRPDAPDGSAGIAKTSFEELARLRADQASDCGVVDIAGKQYYALGQGSPSGALAFFSKEEIDARGEPGKDPRALKASAVADVAKVVGGMTERLQGKPALGKFDGADYRLVFDNSLKIWTVEKGKGDEPPPEPKKVDAKGGKGKPEAGAAGGPDAKAEADVVADGDVSVTVAKMKKDEGYQEPEPDVNEDFDDATKLLVHILVKPGSERPWCFALAPGIGDKNKNRFCPSEDPAHKSLRGFNSYGVLEAEEVKMYLNLRVLDGKTTVPTAVYQKEVGAIRDVPDYKIAIDMLGKYLGVTNPETLEKIQTRLEERVKAIGGKYTVSGKKDHVVIHDVEKNVTYQVWPHEAELKGDGSGAEAKGQGTAMAFSVDTGKLPPTISEDAAHVAARLEPKNDDGVGLYELEDSKEKKYFLILKAKVGGEVSRSKRIQILGTGKDWNPLPAQYEMRGYADVEVEPGAKLVLVKGGFGAKTKGVFSLYNFDKPSDQIKDKKKNFVGPVFWWGINAQEAEEAGKKGSF